MVALGGVLLFDLQISIVQPWAILHPPGNLHDYLGARDELDFRFRGNDVLIGHLRGNATIFFPFALSRSKGHK